MAENIINQKVELNEMLEARENRQAIQEKLRGNYKSTIISFTLNIAGEIKVFPLSIRCFDEGERLLEQRLFANHINVLEKQTVRKKTGFENFYAVDADAVYIKKITTELDERVSIGRLYDIDVEDSGGKKISRTDIGFEQRKCLICDNQAFVCGRSRAHSLEELFAKTCEIIEDYFAEKTSLMIGDIATKSLVDEVITSPKAGLVDKFNNGSHKDMDLFTFTKSAFALRKWFTEFAKCGIKNKNQCPKKTFEQLREIGKLAEYDMYIATDGVNTHKGAIFSMGILCAVYGAFIASGEVFYQADVRNTVRQMCENLLDELHNIGEKSFNTNGEKMYLKYKVTGIRGEAKNGFPVLFETALPIYSRLRESGMSKNDAGVITLLNIIANSEDSNIISRSDYETMIAVKEKIAEAIDKNENLIKFAKSLDTEFIDKNISAGGSADILAMTYFVYEIINFFR